MINFRYHIVSLMAVFIALSVGIAVGVSLGPSVDQGIITQAAQDRKQVADLRAELDRRNALDEYREAYDQRAGKAVVEGVLSGVRVADRRHARRADRRGGRDLHRRRRGRRERRTRGQDQRGRLRSQPGRQDHRGPGAWAADINSDDSMTQANKVGLALARSIAARGCRTGTARRWPSAMR